MEINKTNRSDLKSFFEAYDVPAEGHFSQIFDAMLSQADDSLAKLTGQPIAIQAEGDNEELLGFYTSFEETNPSWVLSQNKNAVLGFNIHETNENGIDSMLFIKSSSGEVGINTQAPEKRLHIEDGELRVEASHNNTTADIAVFMGNNLIKGMGFGYNRIEAIGGNENQNILILPKGTGKVGINSTDPQAQLFVQGDTTLTDSLTLKNGSNAGATLIKLYASEDDGVIDVYNSNSIVHHIHGNGVSYFGGVMAIGNTDPGAYTLQVTGSLNMTDLGSFYLEGTAVTTTATELNYADVTPGTLTASKAMVVDSNGKMDMLLVDNVIIDGNTVKAGSSSGLHLYEDGNNGITIGDGGNVGIGMTLPTAPLHIITSSNGGPINNGIYVYNENNSANQHAILGLQVAGTSAGDPFLSFDIYDVYGWSAGIDNSDSDKFKIAAYWNSLATNTRLTIDTSGNVGIGTTSPDFKLEVEGTARANKYVVQNAVNGGNTRGIMMWQESNTAWGIYMGQSGLGKSLSGGTAVAGDGFTSHSMRFRSGNGNAKGFIFENSAESRLLSIRGNDAFTSINGTLQANKYVVQDEVNGTDARGIYMWTESDTNWGIYMGQSGGSRSLDGAAACAGDGFSSYAVRFRVANNATQGFIFENYGETRLLSIRGSDGYASFSGQLKAYKGVNIGDGNTGHINEDGAFYNFAGWQPHITVEDNFYIRDTSSGTKMHFDTANGRLGINALSPEANLEVNGNGNVLRAYGLWNGSPTDPIARIVATDTNIAESGIIFNLKNAAVDFDLLNVHYQGTSRFYVHSSGQVGVGTDNPDSSLEINAGTSGDATLLIEADTAGNTSYNPLIQLRQDGGTVGMNIGFDSSFGANRFGIGKRYSNNDSNNTFIIDTSTGCVGIGRQAPTADLHISDSYGISYSDGANVIGFGYSPNDGKTFLGCYPAEIRHEPDTGGISFGVDATYRSSGAVPSVTTKVKLTKEGYLGIGTTTPGNVVSIGGDVTVNHQYGITWRDSNATGYGIYRTSGNWTSPNYQQLKIKWLTGMVFYPHTAYDKSYVDVQGDGMRVTSGGMTVGPVTDLGSSTFKASYATTDFMDVRFSGSGMGQLEITGESAGWSINTKTNGEHLYINRDAGSNSDVYLGRSHYGYYVFVDGNNGYVGVNNAAPSAPLYVTATGTGPTANGLYLYNSNNASNEHAILGLEVAGTSAGDPFLSFDINGVIGWSLGADNSNGDKLKLANHWAELHTKTVMSITTSTQYVGINDISPTVPLEVRGYVTQTRSTFGYVGNNNNKGYFPGSMNINTTIVADNRIRCPEFNIISDSRIKTNLVDSDIYQDMDLLKKLKVTDYQYIDEVEFGLRKKKGFIAQEVEEVIPDAVSLTTSFIPNIYCLSSALSYNEEKETLSITIEQPHGLESGDKVRLFHREEFVEKEVTEVISDTTFIVKDWEEADNDKVFVFGKEVEDFRVLDYSHIFSVGVGAIQALDEEIETLMQEIEWMEEYLAE